MRDKRLLKLGSELRDALQMIVKYMDLVGNEETPCPKLYLYGSILIFTSLRFLDEGSIGFEPKPVLHLDFVLDSAAVRRSQKALRFSTGRKFRRLACEVNLAWDNILDQMDCGCLNCECNCSLILNFTNLLEIAQLIHSACVGAQFYYPPKCICDIILDCHPCDNCHWFDLVDRGIIRFIICIE